MSYTTENNYVSNGTTVLYSFTFPYINDTDVIVSLNQLNTSAFTLVNATTIELDEAPASGVSIRIYRSTPTDAISAQFFPGSAIRAQDLNANFEQTLFVVQENQTIIDNSDAASVVGIANEALATANQAKNTADSVSGIANQALTEAGEAETTANQALADSFTAQATALDAKSVADNALSPSSVISDLSNVSSVAPADGQALVWNGSTWLPGNVADGSGPVASTDIYGTAKAWGNVTGDGVLRSGFNCTVQKINQAFRISFPSPLEKNYTVTFGSNNTNSQAKVVAQNTSSMDIQMIDVANGTPQDRAFFFACHDSEPVEATLTTFGDVINYSGAAAWASVAGDGTLNGGLNIASVTKAATGTYDVVFTTPMPSVNYAVATGGSSTTWLMVANQTANGFQVVARGTTSNSDEAFSFTVHALNALPPKGGTGTDAWGSIDGVTGNIVGSFNASSSKVSTGIYQITFTTPMPTSAYAPVITTDQAVGALVQNSVTTTGFQVATYALNGTPTDGYVSFTVNATNATLPSTFTVEQFNDLVTRVTALENA
jgi:hypothetical protein